jgi:hypothetical protein
VNSSSIWFLSYELLLAELEHIKSLLQWFGFIVKSFCCFSCAKVYTKMQPSYSQKTKFSPIVDSKEFCFILLFVMSFVSCGEFLLLEPSSANLGKWFLGLGCLAFLSCLNILLMSSSILQINAIRWKGCNPFLDVFLYFGTIWFGFSVLWGWLKSNWSCYLQSRASWSMDRS